MADKKTVVAVGIVAGLAALGIAAAASASEDESDAGPLPPPPRVRPPAGGGGLTPMQRAKQHPNYGDWLYATQQCDQWIADGMNANSPLIGFCDDAAYFASVMVNDGVPAGQWR